MKSMNDKQKVNRKRSYLLELEGEITVLHLSQSSSKKTRGTSSQIVVNYDNGNLKDYTSEVIALTSEQVQKILSIIGYVESDFRKKYVK